MATPEQLKQALINADKAGDTQAAQKLALALKGARPKPDSERIGLSMLGDLRPTRGQVKDHKSRVESIYGNMASMNGGPMYPSDSASDEEFDQYFRDREAFEADQGRSRAKAARYQLPEQPKQSRGGALVTGLMDTGLSIPGLGHAVYGGMDALVGKEHLDGGSARESMRRAKKSALEDHPVTTRLGDAGGFTAGIGGAAWKVGAKASAPTTAWMASKLPQGASVANKLTRYGGRLLPTMAGVGAESALFGATAEADNRALEQERDVTLGDRVSTGAEFGTDPLNLVGVPALSAIARTGKLVKSGGQTLTPDKVVAEQLTKDLVGIPTDELRPQAMEAVYRLLKNSGLGDDQIAALNREVSNRVKASESGTAAGRKRTFQHYMEVLAEDPNSPLYNPQAASNIQMTVQERASSSARNDGSGAIVGRAVEADRASQVPFLEESAKNNLGQGTRLGLEDQVAEVRKQLGDRYNEALTRGPASPDSASALKSVIESVRPLMDGPSGLKVQAVAEGIDLEKFIQDRPLEAAHWMQSAARRKSQSTDPNASAYAMIRKRMLPVIEGASPEYRDIRKRYGTNEQLDKAASFGDKLFGGSQSNLMNNPGLRSKLVRDFKELPEQQKQVALASIRDQAMGRMQGGQAGSQARLSQLNTVAALDFLEEIGQKGFANDIRAVARENQLLNVADAGNPLRQSATFSNAKARADAPQLYSGRLANAVDNSTPGTMMGEAALMAFAPHYQGAYAAYRGSRMLAAAGLGTRKKTLEDMTKFLMSRKPVRSEALNALPDAPPMAASPSAQNALSEAFGASSTGAPRITATLDELPEPVGQVGMSGRDLGRALRDVGEDRQAFEALMQELERAPAAEALAAARAYAPISTKSKKEALQIVRREFAGRIRQRLKREQSGKATPW